MSLVQPSFDSLLLVVAIAFAAPFLLGLFPNVRLPSPVPDFGGLILLSAFFSGEGGTGSTLILIGSLFGIAGAVYVFIRGAERSPAVMRNLVRVQDTTAQIRVRGAVVLLIGFAALARK